MKDIVVVGLCGTVWREIGLKFGVFLCDSSSSGGHWRTHSVSSSSPSGARFDSLVRESRKQEAKMHFLS